MGLGRLGASRLFPSICSELQNVTSVGTGDRETLYEGNSQVVVGVVSYFKSDSANVHYNANITAGIILVYR